MELFLFQFNFKMLSQFLIYEGGGCLTLQIYMPCPTKFSSSVLSTGLISQLHIKYIYTIQQRTSKEQPVQQMHKSQCHAPNACDICALNAHKDN